MMRFANRKLFLALVTAVVAFSLVGCGQKQPTDTSSKAQTTEEGAKKQNNLTMGTGNTSGTLFVMGAGMCKLLNSHMKEINVTAEATEGAVVNAKLLHDKKVDVAILSSDTAYNASQGRDIFKDGKKEFKGMMTLYRSITHIVALKDSPIKNIQDLKGKRVVIGEVGSGNNVKNRLTMAAFGMEFNKDYKALELSFSEGVDALRDGQADAELILAALPSPALLELNAARGIKLIPFSDEELKTIMAKEPYFQETEIPANTYKGVDYTVKTVAVFMELDVRSDLDEEMVYQMTKTLIDNWNEMINVHEGAKDFALATAYKTAVPLHPGAERYFKEKGLIK